VSPVQAKPIREASDRLRAVGRELPRWHCVERDGRAVLIADGSDYVIAEFPGPWQAEWLRFFTAINGAVLCTIAELMWQIQRGGVPNDVALATERLARLMRFEPRTSDATGWLIPGEAQPTPPAPVERSVPAAHEVRQSAVGPASTPPAKPVPPAAPPKAKRVTRHDTPGQLTMDDVH
jgi:hypothetical protein